jgi:hypothetical protein
MLGIHLYNVSVLLLVELSSVPVRLILPWFGGRYINGWLLKLSPTRLVMC